MNKIRLKLTELLLSLSSAQDLALARIADHHQQVAYLSYRLAEQAGLGMEERKDIFLAAMVHDIGARSTGERLALIEREPVDVNSHAFRGAELLEDFGPLRPVTGIIKYHHLPWENGAGRRYEDQAVPLGSHVVHLADRVSASVRSKSGILSQVPALIRRMRRESGAVFEPGLIAALEALGKKEYIWLELLSDAPAKKVSDILDAVTLDIEDILALAHLFSQIIDLRSSFTARHSESVARIAERLAMLMGFSPYECRLMRIAGYLHDLGKLAVPGDILDKPGRLSQAEFDRIKSHTYYTYQLLDMIPGFKTINSWASYHHERLDGAGYPFHIHGDELTLGARIMAVADIFTAITEDRPYRKGMDDAGAIRVLNNMVLDGALDARVVNILIEQFESIKTIRARSEREASAATEIS